ncbi:MAG: cysteine hydrolase [Chloroflexi bacterium]|nr:cysteine hydrolase [Chloroflexota bacterium]
MNTPVTLTADSGNAVLVIVDVQNEFCKPGGKVYNPKRDRSIVSMIAAIRGLAERARQASVPVIYIQSVRTTEEPYFTVFKQEPVLKIGTWASAIVDELKPQREDIVVQKFSHDPFYRPDLDNVLKRLVPDPTGFYAIVAGGGANVCYCHAVLGFHIRDYWTVVPVDSVYARSDADMERAFEMFSQPAYPNVFLSRSDLITFSTQKTGPASLPIK